MSHFSGSVNNSRIFHTESDVHEIQASLEKSSCLGFCNDIAFSCAACSQAVKELLTCMAGLSQPWRTLLCFKGAHFTVECNRYRLEAWKSKKLDIAVAPSY
jgi:hypothetical protein